MIAPLARPHAAARSGQLLLLALGLAPPLGCGADAASPFGTTGDEGGAAATSVASGAQGGGGSTPAEDPNLGGPCAEDAQCDDGADCTTDRCDATLGRCRFTPDDARCDDAVYCDGAERCTPRVGCEPGTPVDCGDGDACTIDTCEESTRTCTRAPRDADGDGDPDGHCDGGHDCDDVDPLRSSLVAEVCGNARDDDCDLEVDEAGCVAPAHDDCGDALELEGPGIYALQTAGAALDVGVSCQGEGAIADVFAIVTVPDGPARDLDVRASTAIGGVAVAIQGACGDPTSERACGPSFETPSGVPFARALARGLTTGTYAISVVTTYPQSVELDVRLEASTSPPANETCGTAETAPLGTPVAVQLVDAAQDLGTACARETGERVYRFDLDDAVDVDVNAESLDGDGWPSVSLRDEACSLPEDELVCATAPAAHLYRRALEAGPHFIAISATAPTDARFTITTSPPTPRPDDETCETAPAIAPGGEVDVTFARHQDDHHPCITGAADAAYAFDLDAAADVLLVAWAAPGDAASIGLTGPACGEGDLVACSAAGQVPTRLRRRGLEAGTWFGLLESTLGTEQRFEVWARPAAPPVSVPFADACGAAQAIPPGGAFFSGNTTSASADFGAGCDDEGSGPGGAPDRLLRLVLDAPSRVVLDMSGTTYDALLDVRRGPDCPGVEVPLACTVGSPNVGPPYLDLDLEAGTYFVQIDGRGGDAGAFQLDVFVQ